MPTDSSVSAAEGSREKERSARASSQPGTQKQPGFNKHSVGDTP